MKKIIITLIITHILLTLSQSINNLNTTLLPQHNTSLPTLNLTANTRRPFLDCNYGIYYGSDFYETYSINTCYNKDTFSREYNCINSTLSELNYLNNICNGSGSPSSIPMNTYCNNNTTNINNKCAGKPVIINKYDKNITSPICAKHYFINSIPLITGFCIQTPDDFRSTGAIYNEYNPKQQSLIQYEYSTMQECRDTDIPKSNISIISNGYCSEFYYYDIQTPIIKMTPLDCDYGIRMPYETLVVNQCDDDNSVNRMFKSMDRICANGSLIDRYYACESCTGNMSEIPTPGNVNAYCNGQDMEQCEYILLRIYDTCNISDSFSTSGFITDKCILFQDNIFIKNVFDFLFRQYRYNSLSDCKNDTNATIQMFIVDNECKNNNLFKIISPIATTQSPQINTTTPPVTNTTNIMVSTTTSVPTKRPTFKGELKCNYGLLPPLGPNDIYYETFVTNKCYAGYDEYNPSIKYECRNGTMYMKIYNADTCPSQPDLEATVREAYATEQVEEYCNYDNEADISVGACDFVWVQQYDEDPFECKPDGLDKTMAFIAGKCILFRNQNTVIRNDIERYSNDVNKLTQYTYNSYDECEIDIFGDNSQFSWEIPNGDCSPRGFRYWYNIIEAGPTFEPTPQPTQAPHINILECNYGVNYTESSDFYRTYILDTCYDLNTNTTNPPLDVSLQYACDFNTSEINEKVWMNQTCGGDMDYPNSGHLQTKRCDVNKLGKQCNFVWLSSFKKHSTACEPHEHTIIKFGMILDECILYDKDQSAFKNIYTQTETNQPQIIQFQYLSIADCIIDNVTVAHIQSIADDVYTFVHQECTDERYYAIQPAEITRQTTSSPTTTMMPEVNISSTIPKELNLTTTSLQINETTIMWTNITTTIPVIETTTETTNTQSTTATTSESILTTTTEPTLTTTTEPILSTTTEPIHNTTTTEPILTTTTTTTTAEEITTTTTSLTANMCNYMIREDNYMDFYSTILENKCYSHETGSKKYACKDGQFMVSEWLEDRLCDGPVDQPKKAQGKSFCSEGNTGSCNTISVLQFYADETCSKQSMTDKSFLEEYTFIINICLQFTGHKKDQSERIYVYNKYDERNPKEMIQLHFNSYDQCTKAEFGMQATEEDSIKITHEQCTDEFYYEIIIFTQPTPLPTITIFMTTGAGEEKMDPYYRRIYKSIFGPEGPTSIELDIVVLAVIIIFSCLCCGIILWCGWLKGCTDICWNVVCCGRYSPLSDTPINNEDSGDDSVEMGAVAHVLVPDDNMELAALSEHRDDDNQNNNNNQRGRNRKPKKPGKRNRL